MKKYKLKPTKAQIKVMKHYWAELQKALDRHWGEISAIEQHMAAYTGIKDIEFIKDEMFGGEWIGIGNISRTMQLFQQDKLEAKDGR